MTTLASLEHSQSEACRPSSRTETAVKRVGYLALCCSLILSYLFLRGSSWLGNVALHTFSESVSTILAFVIAVLAYVRYRSRRDNEFLIFTAAFAGVTLLDGFHAFVTSAELAPFSPSALANLTPWSWLASRIFLAAMILLAAFAQDAGQNSEHQRRLNWRLVAFGVGMVALSLFVLFIFMPLGQAYFPESVFPRPQEFVPGAIFFAALVLWLNTGLWRKDIFVHWLVLSLVTAVVTQILVMPSSVALFDLEFDVAHVLKIASYLLLLAGLLLSMGSIYKDAESANALLLQEIEEREKAQAALDKRDRELAAKSHLLQTTLENMSHGITVYDRNGRLVAFNQKSIDLREYPPGFIRLGMHIDETHRHKARIGYYGRDNPKRELEKRLSQDRGNEPFYQERTRSNGTVVAIHREPMPDGGFVTTYTDITERTRMERSLRESEERFRKAFEDITVGVIMRNVHDRSVATNQAICDMVGYSQAEIQSLSLRDITHREDRDRNVELHEKLRRGEARSFNDNKRLIRKDGNVIWVNSDMTTINDDHGQPLFTMTLFQDITARMVAELEAEKNSDLLAKVFDTVVQGFAIYDSSQALVSWNAHFEKLFGFPDGFLKPGIGLQEIINFRHAKGCFGDESVDDILARSTRNSRGFQSGERELPDGTVYVFDTRPLDDGGFVISYTDITSHKQSEIALRKAEAYLRTITENVADGLITINQNGVIESFNHAAEKMFGYQQHEVIGENVKLLMPKEYSEQHDRFISSYLKTGDSKIIDVGARELSGMRKDGSVFPMELTVSKFESDGRIKFIGSTRDITTRKDQEELRKVYEAKLSQSEKLQAIGTLAGGIAHDINNTLTPIVGLTQLVLEDLPEDHPDGENLERVLQAAERSRRLVRQILDFSSSNTLDRRPLQLKPTVADAVQLLKSTIPSMVRIKTKLENDMDLVLANESQIHQIVMNLAANAATAIGAKGGAVKITLRQCDLDLAFTHVHPNLNPGRWACLTVEDTGCGMDGETMERIFEPFFTTRDVNEGTGLGLATVHGIVTAHGGTILVSSELDVGTRFDVYLPTIPDDEGIEGESLDETPLGVVD